MAESNFTTFLIPKRPEIIEIHPIADKPKKKYGNVKLKDIMVPFVNSPNIVVQQAPIPNPTNPVRHT